MSEPIAALRARMTLPNIAVGLVFALAFLLTVLPYIIYRSYFPFTGDLQHPLNVASIVNTGVPYPVTPEYLREQYPDSYGYLVAVLAALTNLEPTQALVLASSLTMLAALAAIYALARQTYGARAALFALFAYGLLSYQPRQTYYDGTFIELVSGLVLTPLFLLGLYRAVSTRSTAWIVTAGVLAGALVRYHFIGTVQATLTAALFLIGIAIFRRELINRRLLLCLAAIIGVAVLFSFPYSFYYARIALRIALGRLGVMPAASEQEAAYPQLAFPGDFYTKLGVVFYHVALLALGGLLIARFTRRRLGLADLLILAWVTVLVIGSVTNVFIVPERFLRNLAMPVAVIIGAFLAMLHGRAAVAAVGLTVVLVPSMIFIARRTSDHSADLMAARLIDLPSYEALREARAAEPDRWVLHDESGPWAGYFSERNSFYLHGGPESFARTGEPIRSDSLKLWAAYRAPCEDESKATFGDYDIGYVFLGRRPTHWFPPGFEYQDGTRFLACPDFETLHSRVITQTVLAGTAVITDHYYVFRLLPEDEERARRPAWVPDAGLTLDTVLDMRPPQAPDGSPDEVYVRRWYALSRIALGSVFGYPASAPADFTAARATKPRADMLKEIDAAQRARRAGVVGNMRMPEYEFKIWRAAGGPAPWQGAQIPAADWVGVTFPYPPAGVSTALAQDWYVANYIKLHSVYAGSEPPVTEKVREWAQTHTDLELVNEIILMRLADQAGVVGDPDAQQEAFQRWFRANADTLVTTPPED